jgi:hypothetical protein
MKIINQKNNVTMGKPKLAHFAGLPNLIEHNFKTSDEKNPNKFS